MRASQNDRINLVAAGRVKERRLGRGDGLNGHIFSPRMRLGEPHQLDTAVHDDPVPAREFIDQPRRISPPDRARRGQQANRASLAERRRRLDGWHGANNRNVQHGAHFLQRQRAGRVAGDNEHIRPDMIAQHPGDTRDALDQLFVTLVAIGKKPAIGRVMHAQSGGERPYLLSDG